MFAGQLSQFDFDLSRALLDGDKDGLADLGNIPTDPNDPAGNRAKIRDATARIAAAGAHALLVVATIPCPFPGCGDLKVTGPPLSCRWIAHTDWGDVIRGNPFGYGSPMRRASEAPWVEAMIQVGARGLGSGEAWQIADARAWHSQLVTMQDVRRDGIATAVDMVKPGAKVLLTIDCDGVDPAVLPAVNMPTPGGLTYGDMIELITGVCAKASLCGVAITE